MNAVIGMSGLLLDTRPDARSSATTRRSIRQQRRHAAHRDQRHPRLLQDRGRASSSWRPSRSTCGSASRAALDLVATRAAEKGLDLAYLLGDGVPARRRSATSTRLRQVLLNLLSNAVKFTERGEVVLSVAARRTRPRGGSARARVLGARHRHRHPAGPARPPVPVVQPGRRLDDPALRRHRARAGDQPAPGRDDGRHDRGRPARPGRAATFSFSIPAHASDVPVRVHRDLSGVQPTLRGKRVLVVDDNATNRRIVTVHLDTWGMPSRATESPLEALEWLQAGEHFDLAILDMHMPEMDGVGLARAIRTLPAAGRPAPDPLHVARAAARPARRTRASRPTCTSRSSPPSSSTR